MNSIFSFLFSSFLAVVLFSIFYFLDSYSVLGAEFTSPSFKVIDLTVSVGGGRGTSASFQLETSVGQPAPGRSTSSSFEVRSGFLYFPAPTPAPSPAPAPAPAPPPATGGALSLFRIVFPTDLIFPFLAPLPEAVQPSLPVRILRCGTADFHCDDRIDLADFSTFLFASAYAPAGNPADLNGDGRVDLADASILFSHWTEQVQFVRLPPALVPAPPTEEAPGETAFVALGLKRPPRPGVQEEEMLARVLAPEERAPGAMARVVTVAIGTAVLFITVFLATKLIRFFGGPRESPGGWNLNGRNRRGGNPGGGSRGVGNPQPRKNLPARGKQRKKNPGKRTSQKPKGIPIPLIGEKRRGRSVKVARRKTGSRGLRSHLP